MPFGSKTSLPCKIGSDADGTSVLRRNTQVCKEQSQLRALTLGSTVVSIIHYDLEHFEPSECLPLVICEMRLMVMSCQWWWWQIPEATQAESSEEGQAHGKLADISVHSWWFYGFWGLSRSLFPKKAQEELGWPVVFICLSYCSFLVTKHHDQHNLY